MNRHSGLSVSASILRFTLACPFDVFSMFLIRLLSCWGMVFFCGMSHEQDLLAKPHSVK